MKFIFLALLFFLHSINSYAEIATTGDSFKLYFDLTTSPETITRKAMFPTLFFSADNPLDAGEGWTSRIYDMSGKPLAPAYNIISLEDYVRISDYGYADFDVPIGNIQGYFEFTNLIGSFELIDEADPQITSLLSNGVWESKSSGKLKLTKTGAAVPKIPRLSVDNFGSTVFINSDSSNASTGTLLSYAPYPNAEYVGTVDLGEEQLVFVDLPDGSALYVAIQNYNTSGLSGYSNVENFQIQSSGSVQDEKSFPYPIKGINVPDVWPDHFGLNSDLQPMDEFIDDIVSTGANTVKITMISGIMTSCDDNDFDPSLTQGSQLSDIESFISLVQKQGMKIVVCPFFLVQNMIAGDSSGCDRPQPTDPVAWFVNYRERVLDTAKFAQQNNAEYFLMMADEVQHLLLEPLLTDLWVQLAKDIKQIYSGKLSSQIWSDAKLFPYPSQIPSRIIDELDVVGVAPFPKFTEKNDPSVNELIAAYFSTANGGNVINFLESIHKLYGKNVLITDRAFHSFDGANIDESVIFNTNIPIKLDEQEQQDLFEAYFFALSSQNWNWLDGILLSSMHRVPLNLQPLFARFLGPYGEVFMGKPAEQTVRDWFDGQQ